MNRFWKRALCAVLTASFAIGALAGCGGGDKKAAAPSQPAAGQKVKINFPTASASGALYAVGAAITNNWNKTVPGVQASSQASAGGIANLNMVSDGEAQVSIAISSNVSQCLNGTDSFKLTFAEIEEIASKPIDHSFLNYKKELPDYGFKVGKISLKNQTVAFERV